MKKNVGTTDKIIRIIIALVLSTLVILDVVSGTLAIVFLVIATIMVFTSLVSFCGIYTLFGCNSCKSKK